MKKLFALGCILLFGTLIFNQEGLGEDEIFEKGLRRGGQKYIPGEIIVKFKSGTNDTAIASLNLKNSAVVLYTGKRDGIRRLQVPRNKRVPQMAKIYSKDPDVEYAEPNYIAQALWTPNDKYYEYQWHMYNSEYGGINMEDAWDIETGNSAVIVAVVDTGVAYENYSERVKSRRRTYYYLAPDLAKTSFVPGYDFVNDDTHPNDDEGHGTHVAGIIAQSTDNRIGVSGIAFNCFIMPVKVLDKTGFGTHADIAEGICYAADNGANVINLSLGGADDSVTLREAVAYAYSKGVTIVAASGNDGSSDTISYPAAYDDYCIAVGATRYDETVSYYSNGGESLDLVAPGGDLDVDQNDDGYPDGILQQTFGIRTNDWGYYFYAGTSCAAAHVSGVAALLISSGVAITPDEVRDALKTTAEDKGANGWDPEYGSGIVDAYAALQWTGTTSSQETSENLEDTEPPIISDITGNITTMAGSDIDISAVITDNIGVTGAILYYTPIAGSLTIVSMDKNPSDDIWSTEISIPSDKSGDIPYYVTASDGVNETRDPASDAYVITVKSNPAPLIVGRIIKDISAGDDPYGPYTPYGPSYTTQQDTNNIVFKHIRNRRFARWIIRNIKAGDDPYGPY